MKPSGQVTALLAVFAAVAALAACQGRSGQDLVVDKGAAAPTTGTQAATATVPLSGDQATTPPAASGSLSAADMAKGRIYVNGWLGTSDEADKAPSVWSLSKPTGVSVASGGGGTTIGGTTGGTAGGGTAGAGTTGGGNAAGGGGGGTPTLDPNVVTIVQANCGTGTCHGGPQKPPLGAASDIANAKSAVQGKFAAGADPNMPFDLSSDPAADADKATIAAWVITNSGAAAGGAPSGGTAGTLSLVEDSSGNCTNPTPATGVVGGKLTINNGCKSDWTPHTGGKPFPHGNAAIPAGSSHTYTLCDTYTPGTDPPLYRHTDGSDNSATQSFSLTVTGSAGDCSKTQPDS